MAIFFGIFFGFVFLFIGGESLVRGAIQISQNLKISKLLIGITVVAYGTSSPELLITLQATLKDHHEIAFGNVLGSNITNIFLVFGLCAVIYPIKVAKKIINFDIRYMVIATIALIIFASLGIINRFEGFILIFLLFCYTVSTYRLSYNNHDVLELQVNEVKDQLKTNISTKLAIVLVIVGAVALAIGSELLVDGASRLAIIFNIPPSVIAVTIVALGGCAPEIVTSVIAATKKHSDIAVGNIIGSNLFNILGVIGITSIIKPISTVSTSLSYFGIWVMLFSAILLYLICYFYKAISRKTGYMLLFLYFLYLSWQVYLVL